MRSNHTIRGVVQGHTDGLCSFHEVPPSVINVIVLWFWAETHPFGRDLMACSETNS